MCNEKMSNSVKYATGVPKSCRTMMDRDEDNDGLKRETVSILGNERKGQ